jgi:hypothetical protein
MTRRNAGLCSLARGRGARRLAWLPLLGASLLGAVTGGCKASAHADAKMSSADLNEEIKDFDRPLEPAAAKTMSAPLAEGDVEGEFPLLGARHDLSYGGPTTAVCKCLAIRVEDRPESESLHWDAAPPLIDRKNQWIVALSSKGVPCDGAPADTLGASYQGYETDGDDVVIYVEALGEGRPMTTGAIIPRPPRDGGVYVEAAGSVYGKPLNADKRCKVPSPVSAAPAPAEPVPQVTGK